MHFSYRPATDHNKHQFPPGWLTKLPPVATSAWERKVLGPVKDYTKGTVEQLRDRMVPKYPSVPWLIVANAKETG